QSFRVAGLVLPGLLEVGERLLDLSGSEDDVAEIDEHARVVGTQLGCPAKRSTGLLETARERERAAELAPGVGVVRAGGGRLLQILDRIRLVELEPREARDPEQVGI